MYFYGTFLSHSGSEVTVHILTDNDRTRSLEIGEEKTGLFFTVDPVEIRSCVNDTFDHILRSQATIRLLTRNFIKDFFCKSCFDAVVNIYKDGECVFAGFIEPQTYSQNYNEIYDELELNCIDALSALQHIKYSNIGTSGMSFDAARSHASQVTFLNALIKGFENINDRIDIIGGSTLHYLYDGSKSINSDSWDRYSIFKQLSISELLFIGEEEDSVWQHDTVIEEIMRYLNLHIMQIGFRLYIFSWESIKGSTDIIWRDIITDSQEKTIRKRISIDLSNVASNDANISIGEVYNLISLTCDVQSIDNLIESPLEDGSLTSPYTNRQKYMTEYSTEGKAGTALNAFRTMVLYGIADYDQGKITDWFIQIKDNPNWIFPEAGSDTNIIDLYCKDNSHQELLPNALSTKPGAAIISMGCVEKETTKKDNAPIAKINTSNYLVISVNGNGNDSENATYPNESSLTQNIPMAIYNGSTTGGVFSPMDDDTTNYIVISGKIALSPVMELSGVYEDLKNIPSVNLWPARVGMVPCKNGNRFYTQQFWKAQSPSSIPEWDQTIRKGLVPFTNNAPEQYEFKYSAIGDGNDTISKIAVLACMLIVGDKCVVETGTAGQISDFEWRKYKSREECSSDDEYYQQSFTIGFDPKIGDKLIGVEFNLQNNIDYTLGIDAEGIAIPIRKGDRVNGSVKFMILGPVYTMWDEISRRHPTFFRHTKWTTTSIPLLAHVDNIFIKEFEMKIYSDNGLINNTEDSDLVYISDTDESFINKKDDIKFKIHSALTSEECRELGINNSVNISTPLNISTESGILSIYDHTKDIQAKPEQLYVDSYYNEYKSTKILLNQKLENIPGIVNYFYHYTHQALNSDFYVQSISYNLMENYADLTLKEVES